jgi:hypothetical protein
MTSQVMGAMVMILKVKIRQSQKTLSKISFLTKMILRASSKIQIMMTQSGWTLWTIQERKNNAKRY